MADENPNVVSFTKKLCEVVADQEDEIDRLKELIPVNLPAGDGFPLPVGFGNEEGSLASMDLEAFLNMRTWFEDAIRAKGGRITDGGMGMGRADIGVEIDGCGYSLSIKPRAR